MEEMLHREEAKSTEMAAVVREKSHQNSMERGRVQAPDIVNQIPQSLC